MPWELSPPESVAESAVGLYVTQAYMEQVRGPINIAVWSNKGNETQEADVPAVQAAITDAESEMNDIFPQRYVMPLIPSPYSDADVIRLRRLAEPIASYNLYKQRGIIEDDPIGGALKAERDDAIKKILNGYALPGSIYKLDATQLDSALTSSRAAVANPENTPRPFEPRPCA